MNVNSFQDREQVTPCQKRFEPRPSEGQAKAEQWPNKGQEQVKQRQSQAVLDQYYQNASKNINSG